MNTRRLDYKTPLSIRPGKSLTVRPAYCLCPQKFSVTYAPLLGLWPILILAIFASKIRNCVLILQRYFELYSEYCAHGTKYITLLCFGYYPAVHISGGLTSQRAAQCNGILITVISILVFPIKPHYMKLLLHASTQIQFSYLRICIFHFSFVPID